jgi:hypothetical protein
VLMSDVVQTDDTPVKVQVVVNSVRMAERAETFSSRHRRLASVVMEMRARPLCGLHGHVDWHRLRQPSVSSQRRACQG